VWPDCQFQAGDDSQLDFIHRTAGATEIYFVANRTTNAETSLTTAFRVTGKAPELWNAVTGEHKFAAGYEEKGGRTYVPLDFAPCGSWFVVFREAAAAHPAVAKSNSPELNPLQEISGAWSVHFDPKWGGPEAAQFDSLVSWPTRSEPGIKFYSGTATYEKTFTVDNSKLKTQNSKFFLDLGDVRQSARVRVNGKDYGTLITPPFRVVVDNLKPAGNVLEVEVTSVAANRIRDLDRRGVKWKTFRDINIVDIAYKPFDASNWPLTDCGLLGPVTLTPVK
jgi:hypothetical protein